jgi:ATP-dependent exoDNAse (exonuclease V) beta subunit
VLALEAEESTPLRHQLILEVDTNEESAAASQEQYDAWKSARAKLLMRASHPSLPVQTITSLSYRSGTKAATESDVTSHPRVYIERVKRGDVARPSGRRFGALVHAVLASIYLNADLDAIKALADLQGKIVNATREEMEAAIAVSSATLAHPILRRAAESAGRGALRRETPIQHVLDDGTLVEGVIDLAFRDDLPEFSGWTVVDFKTDREFEAASTRYIAQVQAYSAAIAAATSSPSRGVLLVI